MRPWPCLNFFSCAAVKTVKCIRYYAACFPCSVRTNGRCRSAIVLTEEFTPHLIVYTDIGANVRDNVYRRSKLILSLALLIGCAAGQRSGSPPGGAPTGIDYAHIQFSIMDLQASQERNRTDGPESRSDAISNLDLKASRKARKEYEKGSAALSRKDLKDAVLHLSNATALYSSYVGAHEALGVAYMDVGQPQMARDEFQSAVSLDGHLPDSFANLCSAELAVGDYSAAQQAIEKASSLAPLNLEFLTRLAFAELLNRQYEQAISTAHKVHERKHTSAAIVHYLAALAWRDQGKTSEMRAELQTFLTEAPSDALAEKARRLIAHADDATKHVAATSSIQNAGPTAAEIAEEKQVKEAEATCEGCSDVTVAESSDATNNPRPVGYPSAADTGSGWILRETVDEVSLLFAATDHGKSVSDLTSQDVRILDNDEPPLAVVDFRSETQLPLRLGLVIDTSGSISSRFAFEQDAAQRFIRNVVTNQDDLGFLVGFANSVLLVRDFTSDTTQLVEGIQQLAPGGGTALWDAVSFASRKIGSRTERGAVARILVVISDGEDNSSAEPLKQAIQFAQDQQVAVYTISTCEPSIADVGSQRTGERALKVLAEQTGGASFVPGSIHSFSRSLTELQEVIRSRYLISYKPAHMQLDGSFRHIDLKAEKSGHKLRVFSRRGYTSKVNLPGVGS